MELTQSRGCQKSSEKGHLKSTEVKGSFLKEAMFEMYIKIWLGVNQVKKAGRKRQHEWDHKGKGQDNQCREPQVVHSCIL